MASNTETSPAHNVSGNSHEQASAGMRFSNDFVSSECRSATAVNDAALGKIIRCKLHRNLVAAQDANIVLSHFPRYVRGNDMSVFQLHTKLRVW